MENITSSNQTSPEVSAQLDVLPAVLALVGFVLNVVSIVFLLLTLVSYVAIRNLRTSVAGKMVINMAAALLVHHITLLLYHDRKGTYDRYTALPAVVCSIHATLFIYSITVLMLLFAAEAVNLFMRIVLVFSEIDRYVIKATIVAWITPLFVSGFLFTIVYLFYSTTGCAPYFPPRVAFPMVTSILLVQLFTWIVFAAIACVMCHRSYKSQQTAQRSEFKKSLGILVLLFTFLGLPWLVIAIGSVSWEEKITMAMIILDVLQGPALFVIRVVRLREVRQFWKRLLCNRLWRKPRNQSSCEHIIQMHIIKSDDSAGSY